MRALDFSSLAGLQQDGAQGNQIARDLGNRFHLLLQADSADRVSCGKKPLIPVAFGLLFCWGSRHASGNSHDFNWLPFSKWGAAGFQKGTGDGDNHLGQRLGLLLDGCLAPFVDSYVDAGVYDVSALPFLCSYSLPVYVRRRHFMAAIAALDSNRFDVSIFRWQACPIRVFDDAYGRRPSYAKLSGTFRRSRVIDGSRG